MKIAYFLPFLFRLTSAAISAASVTMAGGGAGLVAGATPTTCTIAFTSAVAIKVGGKIIITFPAGFDVSSAALQAADSGAFDGASAMACVANTRVCTITRDGTGSEFAADQAAGPIVLTGVKNPTVSGATATFTFTTTEAGGGGGETKTDVTALTITAGAISSATVTKSVIAGASDDATIAFTTANPIPLDGKILITFPNGYTTTSAAVKSATTGSFDGSVGLGESSKVITLTRSGGGVAAAGAITDIVLTGIVNSSSAGATGTFTITTQNAAAAVIDTLTTVPQHTIVAANCALANNAQHICGLNPCGCATSATDCSSVVTSVATNFAAYTTGRFCTANAAFALAGTLSPADNVLYFIGEPIAAVTASKTFCLALSRKEFKDNTGVVGQKVSVGAVAVVTADANAKTCTKNTAAAALEVNANILAYGAVGDPAKFCQTKVLDIGNPRQVCATTEICDPYYDIAQATKDACITTNTRIANAALATAPAVRCIAAQQKVSSGDTGSLDCPNVTDYCNHGAKGGGGDTTATQRCVVTGKKLGGAAGLDVGVRVEGSAADVICIGKTYWGICEHLDTTAAPKQVCNPYTATSANICLKKADVLGASAGTTTSGHGLSGSKDKTPARVAADPLTYCIPKTTEAEEDCKHDEVCNWGSILAATTCIKKTLVLGALPAAGAGVTALGQVRQAAVALKYCFARSSATHAAATAYFAKICEHATATAEICNPNATVDGDVCILATKVIDHGVKASAGTAPAPNKDHCIGDLAYKKALATTAAAEEVCNWGAATSADSGIVVTELLDAAKPLEAYRVDGAKGGTTAAPAGKWCFSKKTGTKSDAKKLAYDDTTTADVDETEVCNPNGERGGATDDKKVNVLKKKVLAHGVAVTAKQVTDGENICIGEDASNACLENQACVYKTGACVDFATTDNTILERFTAAEEGKITCFGASDTEDCELTYFCNPFGTTLTGGTVKAADGVETSICWNPEALAELGGYICPQFEEDEEEKTLANVTGAILCDADKPYCATDGTCTADETLKAPPVTGEFAGVSSSTVADGGTTTTTEGDGSHAATTPVWIGLAIAATLW